jgi:hypothetical protein
MQQLIGLKTMSRFGGLQQSDGFGHRKSLGGGHLTAQALN